MEDVQKTDLIPFGTEKRKKKKHLTFSSYQGNLNIEQSSFYPSFFVVVLSHPPITRHGQEIPPNSNLIGRVSRTSLQWKLRIRTSPSSYFCRLSTAPLDPLSQCFERAQILASDWTRNTPTLIGLLRIGQFMVVDAVQLRVTFLGTRATDWRGRSIWCVVLPVRCSHQDLIREDFCVGV